MNDQQNFIDAARAMGGDINPNSYIARDPDMANNFARRVHQAYGLMYAEYLPTPGETQRRLGTYEALNNDRINPSL